MLGSNAKTLHSVLSRISSSKEASMLMPYEYTIQGGGDEYASDAADNDNDNDGDVDDDNDDDDGDGEFLSELDFDFDEDEDEDGLDPLLFLLFSQLKPQIHLPPSPTLPTRWRSGQDTTGGK